MTKTKTKRKTDQRKDVESEIKTKEIYFLEETFFFDTSLWKLISLARDNGHKFDFF